MTTTPAVSVSAIKALLGTKKYMFKDNPNNVQVNLNLINVKKDGDKFEALVEAFNKLREAGYAVTKDNVRLTNRVPNPEDPENLPPTWRSWLCVYVNKPQGQSQAVTSAVNMEQIKELKALGFSPKEIIEITRGNKTAVSEAAADEPTEEVETTPSSESSEQSDDSEEETEPVV